MFGDFYGGGSLHVKSNVTGTGEVLDNDIPFGGGIVHSAGGLLGGFPLVIPVSGAGTIAFPVSGIGSPIGFIVQHVTIGKN